MAKWSLEQWSWDEGKIRKALEGFRTYLKSDEGKKHIDEHERRKKRAQEFLKDGTTIDRLTNEQLAELLRDTDAYYGDRRREAVRKIEQGDDAYITKVKDWLKRLIAYGGQGPLPVTDYLSVGYASELLTMRFPDRFYLLNNASRNGINKLGQGKLPTDYSEWRPLFEYLRGQIDPIVQQELGRPADFYDVDLFLWWLARRKDKPNGQEAKPQMPQIWRVAPGRRGEWWNECRENGCIVIGWNEAAKEALQKALQNDFSQLSKDELKDLFKQVYRGKSGSGGWSQVWRFVHEIQPGDIIVAKRGTEEILGIGIVTSDCIPPKDSAHPFASDENHELHYTHARKVDWRITESVQVDFNLGGQTVVRENRWDDIKEAYQRQGIDVNGLLQGNGPPPPSDTDPPLVRYFKAKGFQFTKEQVVAFYAALKTKGFVILSGLSGTGKTKLAQLFAGLFTFEREVEPEIGKDEIVLTVQPYMLKYRRFIIPVGYWHLLPSLNVGEELSVEVTVEGTKETCRLKRWEHPAHEQGYMQLLLKGTVAAWFANNLKEGDRFSLQFDYDENGNLRGITISRVQKVKIKEPACCFLSVRPDWRDSKALLGYYNPLTEGYESTPLLEFLLQAARDYEQNGSNAQPYFVILDEMNLAHVEYYFADFLSVLESGRDDNGWTKEALRLHSFSQPLHDQDGNEIPSALRLPPNLYIIGTVNIDETTYMFSPKVLDRAFTLEFREVNFGNYPPKGTDKSWTPEQTEKLRQNILENLRNGGKFCAVVADKDVVKEALQNLGDKKTKLEKLNCTLQPYDLHFGYRVMDEIALFVQNATQAPDDVVGKLREDKALDYAVLMKVLPKFHGPRQKLEKALWEVLNWCLSPLDNKEQDKRDELPQRVWECITGKKEQPSGEGIADQLEKWAGISEKFRYANTAKKVLQMLRQLYETGFASFAQ
jgi:5-methylcytosine-specific restriction enzyme B